MILHLDLETYNTRDIRTGVYAYAETAEVLLVAYALSGGPVRVWDRASGEVFPKQLWHALHDPSIIVTAHNALFDRTVLRLALGIAVPIERWRCTMAKAYSHAFPGSLDACCAILGVPLDKAKLADGKKLIHRFCKPAPSNHKTARYDRATHPEEWTLFKHYAARDVEAMREVERRLPDWNWKDTDIALYHLDQRINDRGFRVDQDLTRAGAKAAQADKERMAAEFLQLTGGVIARPGQREKFRAYLNARFGLKLGDTQARTFRELLDGNLDPICRRLMEISVLSNKTSTVKYATLAPAVSSDGRFRGGLAYRGAARTRRWAGRTFQPQNLPSRGLPSQRSVDHYIRALKAGLHEFLFDDLMVYGSAALRGVVIAPEGQDLAVADLSNIEGRILAWLAGEDWKLKAFFDYDAGVGPDLYSVTAGNILGQDPYKISKRDRNVFGKVPELALGYEGGFGAFETFCKSYGVAMADHEDTIRANVDPKYLSSAKANYAKWGRERNPEADEAEWLARETIKLAWRGRHPRSVRLWKACKEAAARAIESPGKSFSAGPWLRFAVKRHAGNSYLLCRLPSGNFLCYFAPRYDEADGAISYMGADSRATGGMFGKWQRVYTYGGKIIENACQSLAVDILAANMPKIDTSGHPIVLTVHDEILTEPPGDMRGDRLAADLSALMSQTPEWLPGFPLAAAGFACPRYRKDV